MTALTFALCTQQYLFKVSKISHQELWHKGPRRAVTELPMLTAAFVCLLLLTHPSDTNVGVGFPKTQQPILIQVMETLKHCWCGWFHSSDLLHTLLPNECLRHLQPLGQKMEVRSKQDGGVTARKPNAHYLGILSRSGLLFFNSSEHLGRFLASPLHPCLHVTGTFPHFL